MKDLVLKLLSNKVVEARSLLDTKINDLFNQKLAAKSIELAMPKAAVDVAENGLIAIELLNKNVYDIILMDIQMPVMGGIEATKLIREHQQSQGLIKIPIVAVTAYAYADDRSKYLSLGMDFLAKPIEINQLKKILIDWLPKHVEDLSSSATPSVQTEHHEVFNKEAMLSRLGGDERLAVNITLSAIQEMPKFIDQLYTSIFEGDWVKVKLITHTLKGLVAHIGGEDLTQKITRLDNHLRNGEYIDHDSVQMIENGYHALVNEMIEQAFIKHSDINA
jgi:two-component system sensor histidine kinase/response regulator